MHFKDEFKSIAKYILGVDNPPEELSKSYENAVGILECDLNTFEERVWSRMLKSNFLFGLYDSGFTLLYPSSNLKKRIFVGLAILETNNHYYSYFLDEGLVIKELFYLFVRIPYAIFQGVVGGLLVYTKI